MNKRVNGISVITIDTAKLKPIRCTGKTIPTMSLLDEEQRRTICQGTVIGMISGQVLFVSSDVSDGGIFVSGNYSPHSKRTLRDVAKRETREFIIDGKSHVLGCELIGGRSVRVFCGNCGSFRKIVGISITVDVTEEKLDSLRFK
jgi:hypothetical protein